MTLVAQADLSDAVAIAQEESRASLKVLLRRKGQSLPPPKAAANGANGEGAQWRFVVALELTATEVERERERERKRER